MESTTATSLKKDISLFILLFVNFVFVFKYGSRLTPYAPLIGLAVALVQFGIWKKRDFLATFSNKLNWADAAVLAIFIAGAAIIFNKVPVETLNVDRWSVITSFWDNYFEGKYVYYAKSHMGNPPGPMPVYYILALPFYLMGELGFFSLLGIVAFYVLSRYTIPRAYSSLALLLLCSSVFYMWEVTCRSNILINGTLVLASIVYFYNDGITNKYKHLIITGILTGLCLSTRNVFAIPYIISFLYALTYKKVSFVNLIMVGCIALFVMALSFVPFVYNHVEDFKAMNPFIIQGSYLMPFSYTLIFIALAFVFAFLCRKKEDVYFYSGLVLFLTIVFYFGYHTVNSGFNAAVHDSRADNSYFILCIPFSLYYLLLPDSRQLK